MTDSFRAALQYMYNTARYYQSYYNPKAVSGFFCSTSQGQLSNRRAMDDREVRKRITLLFHVSGLAGNLDRRFAPPVRLPIPQRPDPLQPGACVRLPHHPCVGCGGGGVELSTVESSGLQAVETAKQTPAYKNRIKAMEAERNGGVVGKKKGTKGRNRYGSRALVGSHDYSRNLLRSA